MKRTHVPILFLAVSLVLVGACTPPEDSAPEAEATADQVVSSYVEAIGGLDKIRSIESMRKTGIYVYNGLEHPLVRLEKRGGRCREDIVGLSMYGTSNEAEETIVRAYDSKNAWVGTQAAELTTAAMPDEQSEGFLVDADLEGPLVGYEEKGHSVELVGPTEVEGIPVVELTVTLADGSAQKWYLDAETHLPVMKAAAEKPEGFLAAQTWFFDDYREVAGVQMPFYIQVEEKLFAREYLLDEIEVNVALEDSVFIEPEGTRAPPPSEG
jgi:hypothetical protein